VRIYKNLINLTFIYRDKDLQMYFASTL